MNEFIVESKGHCFLCLNIISTNLAQRQSSSFQYLARYLHLDIRKVFYEDGHDIAPKLLDKVQKAKMRVDLCEVCTKLNNSFSMAYRQLEKIQLEVRSKLDLIHQRMLNNEEHKTIDNLLSEMLMNQWNSKDGVEELTAKLKITGVLRNETMQKCSVKLSTTKPRVRIQRLTPDELLLIENAILKRKFSQLAQPTDRLIKTETLPSNMDTTSEREEDNSFTGYDNDDLEYEPSHLIMKTEIEEKFCSNQIKPVVSVKGKSHQARVKCDSCDKSFSRTNGLRRHQLAIHTGEKFHCEQCGKKFNDRDNLYRHVNVIHNGKKFPCEHCGKKFTSRTTLYFHINAIHQGKKFQCDHCGKKFIYRSTLYRHVQANHLNQGNLPKKNKYPKRKLNQ